MLLQVGLIRLKGSDLVLQLSTLVLLSEILFLHVFFGEKNRVCEGLPDVHCLSRECVVKGLLLRPESCELLLVENDLLLNLHYGLLQVVDFSLEGCVEGASRGVVGVTH